MHISGKVQQGWQHVEHMGCTGCTYEAVQDVHHSIWQAAHMAFAGTPGGV